jgi:hypothetical protein
MMLLAILGSVHLQDSMMVKDEAGTCDKFAGDPWIHFCNGYFKFYLFFLIKRVTSC